MSLLAACNGATTPPSQTEASASTRAALSTTPTVRSLSATDQVHIYAAVIIDLYLHRSAIGGAPAPVIYVGRRVVGGGALESSSPSPPPRTLAPAVQLGISAALSGLPADLVWVDRFADIPFVEVPQPGQDNGATASMSHITLRDDGAALVEGALHFDCNCELGGGSFYVFERTNGRWALTGVEAQYES